VEERVVSRPAYDMNPGLSRGMYEGPKDNLSSRPYDGPHDKSHTTEEPDEGKLCAAGRGAESLTQSRGVRRETPGSSTYLRAKAGGDKSMSEKRESQEGVYGAVPQDPRDMVKAILPEPQFPVVEPHTHRYHA